MGKWIFILISLCIFYSCEYEPKGEYVNGSTINNTPPEVEIDLQFEQDTIIFQWPASLGFYLDVKNTTVNWIDIYMDDNLVYNNLNNKSGKINLNLDGYIKSSGTHKMKLEFFTSSNTGSIADQLEAEGFLFSHEWTILAVPYNTPEIQSVTLEDGQVLLIWDKYMGERFSYYQIQKKVNNKVFSLIKIYDQNICNTIDSSYLGESAEYSVITYSGSSANYYSKWYSFNVSPDLTQPEIKFIDYIPVITYKSELYKNIKSIYLLNYLGDIVGTMKFDGENFYANYNVGQSSQLYTYEPFGRIVDLKLKIVPKLQFDYYDNSELNAVVKTFNSVKFADEFNSFASGHITNSNLLYFNNATTLNKLDLSNQGITTIYEFNEYITGFAGSPNGNYLLVGIQDASFNRNYRIFINGSLSDSIIRYDTFDSINTSPNFCSISNNGISIARVYFTTYIYDCSNYQIIHKLDFPLDYDSKISPDGKYIIGNYGLLQYYAINNSTTINELTVPQQFVAGTNSFIFSETGEYLYLLNSNILYKLNSDDLSIISQFTVDADLIYNIDFNSGLILCARSYHLNLYDLNTGRRLLTVNGDQHSSYLYFIYENTIYTNYGCKLKIK